MKSPQQNSMNDGGAIVTVEDPSRAIAGKLETLLDEIRRLEQHYIRRLQRPPEILPPGPGSRLSVRVYILRGAIDEGIEAFRGHALLGWLYRTLEPYRDQLQASARRRVGQWDPRRHSEAEWISWEAKEQEEDRESKNPLPHASGPRGEWAGELLEVGKSYRETLAGVAYMWMVRSNGLLDRKEALKLRRTIDREFLRRRGQTAPIPPRGWWHPTRKRVTGGAHILTIAWDPSLEDAHT